MEPMTWLTVRTEATRSRTWVGEGPLTEATMVLQSLAVFPAEEQAIHHTEQAAFGGKLRIGEAEWKDACC